MSEYFELAKDIGRASAAAVQEGVKIGGREPKAHLTTILHAYDAALLLPDAKIPTPLHLAIENARTYLAVERTEHRTQAAKGDGHSTPRDTI